MADDFSLIFYDQRGCGRSERPSESNDYSMDKEVELLEELRKYLGIEKLNVLGQSWGSMLGLLYATTYPQHINKLMLVSAVGASAEGYNRFGEELWMRMSEEDKENYSKLSKRVEAGEMSKQDVIKDILKIIYPYYMYDPTNAQFMTKTEINSEVHSIMAKDIIENYDVKGKLDTLSDIPILVGQGSMDLNTPEILKDLLLQYLPNARLLVFNESGHYPFIEEKDKFIEVTRLFF